MDPRCAQADPRGLEEAEEDDACWRRPRGRRREMGELPSQEGKEPKETMRENGTEGLTTSPVQ